MLVEKLLGRYQDRVRGAQELSAFLVAILENSLKSHVAAALGNNCKTKTPYNSDYLLTRQSFKPRQASSPVRKSQ
jgi:hypothetical protein